MREAVPALAQRCLVCMVSGRGRRVQQMVGVDNLVVGGCHCFEGIPQEDSIDDEAATGFENLISGVTDRLRVESMRVRWSGRNGSRSRSASGSLICRSRRR